MAEYVPVGAPTNDSERAGIRQLRDRLPDHYIVVGNFELQLPRRKNTLEYDAVIIGEWGVYAVEIKGWGGTIRGDMSRWDLEWGRVENPFIRIETKAKALRDLLVRKIDDFPDELYCESVVFLPRNDVRIEIDDPRNERLVFQDTVWEFFAGQYVEEGPGLLRDDELREQVRDTILPRAEPGSTAPNVPNYVIEERLDREDCRYQEYIGRHEFLRSRDKVRIKAYALDPLMPKSEREEQVAEVVRDLEALSALDDNDYVARAYDMFRDEEDELLFYLVSEWVGPRTLGDYLRDDGRDTEIEESRPKLALGRHLARAVREMHADGIVHRNLNPDVIYLVEDREEGESDVPLRLADFDYARMTHLRSIAGGLSAIGTEGYAAPEIWNGDEHDYRADIFSLGAVLYELLAGETLYSGISEVLDYRAVWEEKRDRVRPPPLRSLLDEMLVGDPDDRLEDASLVLDALNTVGEEIAG